MSNAALKSKSTTPTIDFLSMHLSQLSVSAVNDMKHTVTAVTHLNIAIKNLILLFLPLVLFYCMFIVNYLLYEILDSKLNHITKVKQLKIIRCLIKR